MDNNNLPYNQIFHSACSWWNFELVKYLLKKDIKYNLNLAEFLSIKQEIIKYILDNNYITNFDNIDFALEHMQLKRSGPEILKYLIKKNIIITEDKIISYILPDLEIYLYNIDSELYDYFLDLAKKNNFKFGNLNKLFKKSCVIFKKFAQIIYKYYKLEINIWLDL